MSVPGIGREIAGALKNGDTQADLERSELTLARVPALKNFFAALVKANAASALDGIKSGAKSKDVDAENAAGVDMDDNTIVSGSGVREDACKDVAAVENAIDNAVAAFIRTYNGTHSPGRVLSDALSTLDFTDFTDDEEVRYAIHTCFASAAYARIFGGFDGEEFYVTRVTALTGADRDIVIDYINRVIVPLKRKHYRLAGL